jgi:hypothetical protein
LEWLDWKILAGLGVAVAIPAWLLWRLFRGFFAIFLAIILLLAGFTGYIYYRTRGAAARHPAIGRHAYLIENDKYLGVVEGEGDDRTRGKVWVVRPPGRYPLIYSKNRVRLQETRRESGE